jgi:diguanylate cyclase (GGDEF)-like protein
MIGFNIAEQIIAAIRVPVPVSVSDSISIHVGVSIGIAQFPNHGNNVETLLKAADDAMYEVKRKGKNGYAIKDKSGVITVTRPTPQKRNAVYEQWIV